MSKGGGGDQDVTQTSEPWAGLQPYILSMLSQASDIYNTGGPQYYPDSQVVPFSPQSQLGMEMLQNRVLQGSPYQNAAGQFALNTLNGTNQNPAMAQFQGLRGSINPAQIGQTPQVQLGNGLTDLTRQTFNQTMQGNYLNSNPYLDQTFNRASDAVTRQWNESVMPGVNSTFSLAGRTGSGAHQNAVNQASEQLGDTLSDLGNQIYGQNYQQERDRMMQSANALGGFDMTQQGYGLDASKANASNALTRNLNQANLTQNARQFNKNFGLELGNAMSNAYQQDFGNRLAASNLGMSLADQDFNDINRLLGLGGMVEGKAGEYLGDQINRFNYYQGAPERNLNWLAGLINSNPAANSAQTTNKNVDQNDGSAFGNFAQNALMAYLMSSDVTLKTNITPKGKVNGFNWYSWTWNDKANDLGLSGDAEGVIAQEVETTRPDLVTMKDGYKAVNMLGVLYGTA